MVKVTLYIEKNVDQNASLYFEKAKKAKKKLKGALEALEKTKKKLSKLELEQPKVEEKPKSVKKKEWYDKYRWFISSEEFLVIGGRDATTNEILIKKHTEKEDVVLHTDMAGSPFFVIKTCGKKLGKKTLDEAASATASYSRAWRLGLTTLDVFYVKPEQVTKKANPGEYLGKGAFMITGKTNYLRPSVELAIGCKGNQVIAGPVSAIKKQTMNFLIVKQGNEKTSSIAKKIKKKVGCDLDDIIRALPAGGCSL
jgi:predicted ribosome quality control (RQC) complex YloA/Tae2 family protein